VDSSSKPWYLKNPENDGSYLMIYPNYPQFMAMMWGNADKPWELRVRFRYTQAWEANRSIDGHRVTARTGLRWSGRKLTARRCLAELCLSRAKSLVDSRHFRRQSIGKAQHGIKQAVEGEDELEFW
jgi:hypothetical protein